MTKSKTKTTKQANELAQRSVAQLGRQVSQTLKNFPSLNLPRRDWRQVVVCGMGGSALAADFLRYSLWQRLRRPVIIVNNYQLPKFVDRQSLVVISSYSGSTEEAISCYRQARRQGLTMVVLTAGGHLTKLAKTDKVPLVLFDTKYNVSGAPRLGLGYSIAALVALVQQLGLSSFRQADLLKLIRFLRTPKDLPIKQLSGRSVIVVASEHLIGGAHVFCNQLNESAKVFAAYFALPEMNHHLLEGFGSLKNRKDWVVIFLESATYSKRLTRRYQLTKAIVKKYGLPVYEQKFSGP